MTSSPYPGPYPGPGTDVTSHAQTVFRALLDAMSNPATIVPVRCADALDDWPIEPSATATLLTVLDADTTIYVETDLPQQVAGSLRFHTGARIVECPGDADFALSTTATMLPLERFKQGSAEYPDRSTTVVVVTKSMVGGSVALASGPGIPGSRLVGPQGFGPEQWLALSARAETRPIGVDVVVCARRELVGLPRSTRLTVGSET